MKKLPYPLLSSFVFLALAASTAFAQNRIYRCGNEYTNNASVAKERNCKVVEGGNVTVVEGTRPAPGGSGAAPKAASSPPSAPRVDPNDQRARDADARAILESELKKAQARLAEIKQEYNDGSPQRNALDLRNPQKYMERTAELKASLARAEADVEGIRREIERLPAVR
ncbi:MAG: hypothetical protein M9919_11815 [Burkholderiaceae bacterium]|jgi:glycine/D-amino acid oxidase-like deaminating enzyme|nr:hypothetical protein [Burkholderiaceae bacterium]MCO5104678.1 hypothetical protein [Burkholderiaceae bacterium]